MLRAASFYELKTISYPRAWLRGADLCLQAHSALVYQEKVANSELLNSVLSIRPAVAHAAQVACSGGHQRWTLPPCQDLAVEAGSAIPASVC